MITEIQHPQWLTLEVGGETVLGYNQEWYPEHRQQMAGCGPTVGSMMVAYAEKKAKDTPRNEQATALSVMLDMWKYATPRMHGLYKTRWLKEGVAQYLADHHLPGKVEALSVPSIRLLAPSLAKACGKDKADVSRMMSVMEEKGLITKEGEHAKLYRGTLKLTEQGRKVAAQITKRAELAVVRAGDGLTEEKREIFYDALDTITANLQRIAGEGL